VNGQWPKQRHYRLHRRRAGDCRRQPGPDRRLEDGRRPRALSGAAAARFRGTRSCTISVQLAAGRPVGPASAQATDEHPGHGGHPSSWRTGLGERPRTRLPRRQHRRSGLPGATPEQPVLHQPARDPRRHSGRAKRGSACVLPDGARHSASHCLWHHLKAVFDPAAVGLVG
jgi:hypothetical protein